MRRLISSCIAFVTLGGLLTLAQAPVVNIGQRHGELRAAQQNIVSAYQQIEQAQHNNSDQLGGHAQRAKDLLIQADQELRQAANTANSEGR